MKVTDFLPQLVSSLTEQLEDDEKRWGDTWLKRTRKGQELRTRKTFEDYLSEGTLAAIDAALKAADTDDLNLVAFCLGGTLAASTLGYLAAHNDTLENEPFLVGRRRVKNDPAAAEHPFAEYARH